LVTKIHSVLSKIRGICTCFNIRIVEYDKNFYITVLWIKGLNALLLVQGKGKMAVLPAVTAVLLHHSAMNTWTECDVISTG
jgi:hypothetical protein